MAIVAVAGIVGVVWYVASWVVAGWLTPGHDPVAQAISELYALGAPRAPAMLVQSSLVASGLALIAFGPALDRGLAGEGRLGPVLASFSGVMTVLVVAFPCTAGCPGAGVSLTDTLHSAVAGTGYVAFVVAPLAVGWRVRRQDPALAWWSLVLGGLALVGLVVRAAGVDDATSGLQQRAFNTVADLWYVVAAVGLLRKRRAGRPATSRPAGFAPADPSRRG